MADQITIINNQRLHRLLPRFSQLFHAALVNVNFGIFNFFQGGEQQIVPASIFPHAALAFTVFVILGFLQVKYQGKDKSPFESHPITISVGVVSILMYCFAFGVQQILSSGRANGMPKCASDTIRWCMLVTGSLSVAATASFLFPDSVRPLLFALYFVVVAGERLYWVYQRFLRERLMACQQFFIMNIWRPLAHSFAQQRQILPL